ncbi:hypothetical protein [Anaerofustis butyriciformans]|uniref:hypothetical protein n=1 Tax=Anaerofustis butyriciformans TaxID=3108533 RepID=UPI002E306B88|nr:hypothetical protein [Anaerofustis sp. HA2171]
MGEKRVKKELNKYFYIVKKIENKEKLINQYKDNRGLKASQGSEVHTNNNSSIDEIITDKIIDIESEVKELRKEALIVYKDTMKLIDNVDNDTYKNILIARHINLKSWGVIANELSYSKSYLCTTLYPNALKYFEKIVFNSIQ